MDIVRVRSSTHSMMSKRSRQSHSKKRGKDESNPIEHFAVPPVLDLHAVSWL